MSGGTMGAEAPAIRRVALPHWPAAVGALDHRRVLIAILVGSAAIRVAWTIIAAPRPESDFLTFLEMARAIGRGAWWPTSYGWLYQGPGYPLVLAPLTLLGGLTLPAIHAFNVALGVLTVALVHRLASCIFDRRAGLVAAAITAAFPGLWAWTPIIGAENLSVPLLVGIAVLIVERDRAWSWALAGALSGYLAFVRPSMLLAGVVTAVALVWITPAGRKGRAIAGFTLGMSLVIGVLATANVLAGGSALPVGNTGWQPWLVHNERATGAWFAAMDRDDYPFHGTQDPSIADIVRAGQTKLALEFIVLNPGEFLPDLADRFILGWGNDRAGLGWTVHASDAGTIGARLAPALDIISDGYYLAVVGAALLGVWLLGGRPVVVLVLVLPIAYLLAPVVIAEGNARYHVNALAFLAVLAAGALTSRTGAVWLMAGAIVLAAWLVPPGAPLGPLLIAILVGVGLAALGLDALRNLRRWSSGPNGRWLRVGIVAVLAGVELALAGGLMVARQAALDWSSTRPEGWSAYGPQSAAGGPTRPVDLVASDVPDGHVKVSFPDSAVLAVPANVRPGAVVGLERVFADLDPGARYVIYLQIRLPDAPTWSDRLSVLLNDRVVWSAPAPGTAAGWQDVVVPWVADVPFAAIRVERVAAVPLGAPDVLVRSVHVYPRY